MRTRVGCLIVFLLLGLSSRAAELTPAVTAADLDAASCALFIDGTAQPATPAQVLGALGVQAGAGWKSDVSTGKERAFRISFTAPLALGTLFTTFRGTISFLAPTAAAPGEVGKDAQWIALPAGALKTFPPGTKTRALRFVERMHDGKPVASDCGQTLLFTERYYNALALGYAKRIGGGGQLQQDGWLGTWTDPPTLAGMLVALNAASAHVETLKPDAALHPYLAPPESWKRAADCPGGALRVYRFAAPVKTRALRMTTQGWSNEWKFSLVVPLVNLGETPDAPGQVAPTPPYQFSLNMPIGGITALDIHEKTTGKLVRRLYAETMRDPGPEHEYWDLKDDRGEWVAPGEYTYKVLVHPELKLTYEGTVYGNAQPPWPAPVKGGGRWMSDHCPPEWVECAGDIIWLGAVDAEDGHSMIAVDKAGNKLWGVSTFGSGGPQRLAADERYGYFINDTEVKRIDPKNGFAMRTVFRFNHTDDLPGNGNRWSPLYGGATARDGKLYVAFCGAPDNWLTPSFKSDAIDTTRCEPVAYLAKGGGHRESANDKVYSNYEYDELMRVYAALLTDKTPASTRTLRNAHIPSSRDAYLGDAKNGAVTVAYNTPITVGAVTVPDSRIAVYALKPGLDLPQAGDDQNDPDAHGGADDNGADPFDEARWIPLPIAGAPGASAIALAPPGGLKTKALRFRAGHVSYALVTGRRFADAGGEAERVALDGVITKTGGWKVDRPKTAPITPNSPAIMGMIWKAPTPLRGISLSMPGGAVYGIDRYTGPDTGDPKAALSDDTAWQQIATARPQGNWNGLTTEPAVHNIDFGSLLPVRALRIRAIYPHGAVGEHGEIISVPWTHVVNIASIVAYRYLGSDPTGLPVHLSGRVSELALPADEGGTAALVREIPVPGVGNLTFDHAGHLFAVSEGQIITVPLQPEEKSVIVVPRGHLDAPSDLTIDNDGLLYVLDVGPKVIKVFNSTTGALVRTIGHPGGIKLGKWDPLTFDMPTGISIDGDGKLWVCDDTYQPKRVVRLTRDGTVEQEFLGGAGYGGGGDMDPRNHAIINYNGMKFVYDWEKRTARLDSILLKDYTNTNFGASMPDRVVYYKDQRYLVSYYRQFMGWKPTGIFIERNGVAVPVAAMGRLGDWSDVDTHADLRKAFGALERAKYLFVWVDKNGDGIPQADEVQLLETNIGYPVSVGEDLAFYYPGGRLKPLEILPGGIPVYDLAKREALPITSYANWGTADGRIFEIYDRLVSADGKTSLWDYYDKWNMFEGFYASGFGFERPPGELVWEHKITGHFTAGKEEFFCTNSDPGDWFLFTADGMMAGCLFGGPHGFPLRSWTIPEWIPGKTDLSRIRQDQEHYQGSVITAENGVVYAIAGHCHVSIIRVEGLEQTRRATGTITVTKEDVIATQHWLTQRQLVSQLRGEPKVAKFCRLDRPIQVDGSLDDWAEDLFVNIHDYVQHGREGDKYIVHSQGALAYDDTNLYVAVRTMDRNGMRNSAQDYTRLFKSGDCVDVTLGVDPAADPQRTAPAPGDVRALIAMVGNKPVITIYRPRVPTAPPDKRISFTSPVAQTDIDVVTVLDPAQVAVVVESGTGNTKFARYVEAAIPWKALGLTAPASGSKLRGDIGLLLGDENGVKTAGRLYWSGKAQTMVSDLAVEARLNPALWGELDAIEPEKSQHFGPGEVDLQP